MTDERTPRNDRGTGGSGRSGSGRPNGAGSGGASRDGRRPSTGRPGAGKPSGDRSERSDGPRRSGATSGGAGGDRERRPAFRRDERPARAGDRPGARTGRPERDSRDSQNPRDDRERAPRDDAPRHDDPMVPEDVTPAELDKSAWRELKALTKENAEWVAGHLVMASRMIDDDPERAHKHALAAARRAGRIPVVRETVGITAYLTGDFALALRELRTYRRLTGRDDQVPLMVDCERGLGRPDRALELAGEVDRSSLSTAVQVELAISRSGARLDMGKPELALGELEIAQLKPDMAFSFSPALFDSYAIVLAELGRDEEAALWGERADVAARALREAVDGPDDDHMVIVDMPEQE